MIVLIDNRDSFTFNLVQALRALGAEVEVVPGHRASVEDVLAFEPRRVLVGPGPGRPAAARTSLELVRRATVPVLGVCLGHQVLALAFGARVETAPRPVHGHPDAIRHDGRGMFAGLPTPTRMGRYHSLAVVAASVPDELEITARAPDGTVQGLRHRTLPLEGVQFHPESILSEDGAALLANFVEWPAGGERG